MVKRFILFLLLSVGGLNLWAQTPGWLWASSGLNSRGNSLERAVTTDINGNVYVVGEFAGDITFGTTTLNDIYGKSLYVAKYSDEGAVLWATSLQGLAGSLYCNAIVADKNGEVYFAGEFNGGILLGADRSYTKGWKDIFLVKLRSDGGFAWGRTYGTKWDERMMGGISLDSKHNIILAGGFCGAEGSPPEMESIAFDNHVLTSQGNNDIFIAKFDSSGNSLWAKDIGSKHHESAFNSTVTSDDKILIVGEFGAKLTLDTNVSIQSISTGFVVADYFVAEFDRDGNALWAKAIGGQRLVGGLNGGAVVCHLVSADEEGNVLIGGNYSDCDAVIGSFILRPNDYNVGSADMWFAKLDTAGTVQWARSAGSTNPDLLHCLKTDNSGSVYLTGKYGNECFFEKDTVFAPITASEYCFVAKYDRLGNLSWIKTVGGESGAVGYGITVGKSEKPIVVGSFNDVGLEFGSTWMPNYAEQNGFVAMLGFPTKESSLVMRTDVEVHPIPANKVLHFQVRQPDLPLKCWLSDATGRILMTDLLNSQSGSIALPALTKGLYMMTLVGAHSAVTKMIFVDQE